MQKKGFIFIIIVIVAIFLGIGYFVNSMNNQFSGPPALTVSEEIGDLGKIMPDKVQTHIFTLKNEGGEALVIEKVQATCGCTATVLSEEEIAPGKTTPLEVTFNPKGYEGVVSKPFYIYSNDPETPKKRIAIKADIEHIASPEIQISTNLWNLGLLTKGNSNKLALIISNQGDLNLDIESIDIPEHIHYDPELLIFPKQLAPEEEVEISFTYDSSEQETGVVREYVRLVTNDPNRKNVTLRIEGYIKEKEHIVSIRPLEHIVTNENAEQDGYEAKFLLKNNSEELLQIVSVQSSVDYLKPMSQNMNLAPGEEREIIIQINQEQFADLDINKELQQYIYLNITLPVRFTPELQ